MTWEAEAWALRSKGLRPAQKFLLLILAHHAQAHTNLAWPSQRTLMFEAEMSERAVRDSLHLLERIDAIEIVQRGNQHRSTTYRLLTDVNISIQTVPAEFAGADSEDVYRQPDVSGPEESVSASTQNRRKKKNSNGMDTSSLWESTLALLKTQVAPTVYDTWLEGTIGIDAERKDGQVIFTIQCPNEIIVEWLGNRMHSVITRALNDTLRESVVPVFTE